jgi:hypothetical protein
MKVNVASKPVAPKASVRKGRMILAERTTGILRGAV